MTSDICADLVRQAEVADRGVEGISVLVASRDPGLVAQAGPRLARRLYPEMRFGRVLHYEPFPAPDWAPDPPREWSEVIVEVLR